MTYSKRDNKQLSQAKSAYTTALLRSLHFNGVQFIRYCSIDASNDIRCQVKPVDFLLNSQNFPTLDNQVSIATVCYAGLPNYTDYKDKETGMDSRNVLVVQPDLKTFRILPYAPKTALIIGNLMDQFADEPSPLCTRSLLRHVVDQAAIQHNIAFSVGIELEFCLVQADTEKFEFVYDSAFANTITLNANEELISELYQQLQQQYIPVELIHSELGPGQLELVLQYSKDPVEIADNVLLAKETIIAVARQYNCKALFAPKYDKTKAGNGMHVHMSIQDATTGEPLLGNDTSMTAKGSAFVEGLLQHLPALMGLSLPTINSHRHVGKGIWTGGVVGWSLESKASGLRVYSNVATKKKCDHIEYNLCDSTCNLYLALAGILSAGIEGIVQSLKLRPSLGALAAAAAADVKFGAGANPLVLVDTPLPATVQEALNALENDDFVMNILGPHLSQGYLALRRNEADRDSKMTLEDDVVESLARA